MANSMIITQLISQFSQLPFELQRRVLDFTQALTLSMSIPKGTSGKKLLSFKEMIPPDDLQTMNRLIEEGCEKVNPNEW